MVGFKDELVLLSTLGKLTLCTELLGESRYRTRVSFRPRDSERQAPQGHQEHATKGRALDHRSQLTEYWASLGWEIRQPWMDKEAKWSNAVARQAPTTGDWGPAYLPSGASPVAPQPAAAAGFSRPSGFTGPIREALPVPVRTPLPVPVRTPLPVPITAAALPAIPSPALPRPATQPNPTVPSLPPGDWAAVEGLVRQAVDCRECFDRGEVAAPFITVAQPRWIPPAYAKQPLRVTVLMINPGESGDTPGARLFLERMTEYRAGRMDLRTLLDFQRETMMRWGNPPGRFARFYFEQLGLSVDQVAFVNVAWCGTKGNTYPGSVLERCFRRHTLPLLRLLAPHVVIASGSSTHRYANALVHELPGIAVEKTLHYAHRSGATVEAEEVARLKAVLAAKRQD